MRRLQDLIFLLLCLFSIGFLNSNPPSSLRCEYLLTEIRVLPLLTKPYQVAPVVSIIRAYYTQLGAHNQHSQPLVEPERFCRFCCHIFTGPLLMEAGDLLLAFTQILAPLMAATLTN